jgi:ketosteroid isomerase-like protein
MRTIRSDRARLSRTLIVAGSMSVLALVAGCSGATQADGDVAVASATAVADEGPAAVVTSYVEAYNADDMDAVLELFTEESTITGHPAGPDIEGLESIRNLNVTDRAWAHADDPYTISDVEVDGDTVTWNHVWISSEGDEWCGDGNEAVVQDGSIVEWTFAPNPHPCE